MKREPDASEVNAYHIDPSRFPQLEKMRTTACRQFTIEFICPAASSNPLAVRMLGNTIGRAFNSSGLRTTGFLLQPRKTYRWKLSIDCYDIDVETRTVREALASIKSIEVVGCRRGKVVWPPIGPRTKPSSESNPHRDDQRSHRNKLIYRVSK